ncbi:MAG: hypothetical protein IKU07_05795 [Oscillospiraceae bacterium]|nr:hypothetical protein [Oscillospiraceae bacterium]
MANFVTNLKEHFAKEKERMKPMTGKERAEHLWMYYSEYLWVVGVVVILLGAVITSLFNLMTKTTVVTGIMVNFTITQEGHNYLAEDYAEKIGAKEGRELVNLEYTVFDLLSDASASEQSYYAAMTVVAEVSAQKLDYILLDKPGMEFYITQSVYMDLREFFSPEEIAQFAAEDRLIYAQEEGSEDKWVVAVDITELPFVQDTVTSEGPIYFALSGSAPHVEQCRGIWEHINAWPAKAAG